MPPAEGWHPPGGGRHSPAWTAGTPAAGRGEGCTYSGSPSRQIHGRSQVSSGTRQALTPLRSRGFHHLAPLSLSLSLAGKACACCFLGPGSPPQAASAHTLHLLASCPRPVQGLRTHSSTHIPNHPPTNQPIHTHRMPPSSTLRALRSPGRCPGPHPPPHPPPPPTPGPGAAPAAPAVASAPVGQGQRCDGVT